MKLQIKKGVTSKLVQIFILDSSKTDGSGLAGLVFNSAGLSAHYRREGAATGGTSISLVTMTLGTWVSGGFAEVDATNMPGWYEVGLPNASLASGADSVGVNLKGAINMAPVPLEIQLIDVDFNDAVAGGMSRLDAAITSRLAPTVAARTLDVSAGGGAGLDWGNIENKTTANLLTNTDTRLVATATNLTNKTGFSLAADQSGVTFGTVNTVGDKTGYSISGTKQTLDALNDIAATAIVSAGPITTFAGAVANVTLVATTTTNIDMRGTDGANTVVPDNAGISTAAGAASAAAVSTAGLAGAAMRGTDGANTVVPPTLAQIFAGGDVDGFTFEEYMKLSLASLGKVSGGATITNIFRAADDSKDRITATVDANGNRSAVVFDAAG